MFSKEYLFQKIEKEHHCLGVTLKNSIKWDDEIVNTIYVVELVMEDDDKETVAELYLVDDETVIIDPDLMEGLDDDLNSFLENLLKD